MPYCCMYLNECNVYINQYISWYFDSCCQLKHFNPWTVLQYWFTISAQTLIVYPHSSKSIYMSMVNDQKLSNDFILRWPHNNEWLVRRRNKKHLLHKIAIVLYIPAELSSHSHLASKPCHCLKIGYCGAEKKCVIFFVLIHANRTPAQCSAVLLCCHCCDSQSWYRRSVRLKIRQKQPTSGPSPDCRVPQPTAVILQWPHIDKHGLRSGHRALRSKKCRWPLWWN